MHGVLAVLIGFLGHISIGFYGLYKLIKLKPSFLSWILIALLAILTPFIIKILFYNAYSGQKVSVYEFFILSIWVTFLPFSLLGLALKKFSMVISNAFYLSLLPSLIYFLLLDNYLISYFKIIVTY